MIRRVLRDYFGYNVQVAINLSQLCMNITDVDDKIINNSNEQNVPYF
jgi:cysteinyl-tRNA synthetase